MPVRTPLRSRGFTTSNFSSAMPDRLRTFIEKVSGFLRQLIKASRLASAASLPMH